MNRLAAWAMVPLAAAPLLAAAATHTVVIEAMAFKPAELTVRPGDKVVWHNKDVVPHTATARGRFDSGQLDAGHSWTWTAGATGEYGYVCTYHPAMKAKVTVR